MLSFKIDNEVKQLLNSYTNFPYEVGGAVFGTIETRGKVVHVKAISFKHGEKYRINFTNKDKQLFCAPNGLILLGTWHSHPFQVEPFPSSIDTRQWRKWSSEYIHIIVGTGYFKIFKNKISFLCKKKLEEVYFEKRL